MVPDYKWGKGSNYNGAVDNVVIGWGVVSNIMAICNMIGMFVLVIFILFKP